MMSNAQWTTRGRMRRRDAVVVSSGPSVLLVGVSMLLFVLQMLNESSKISSYHLFSTPKPPLRVKIAVGTMSRRRAIICREMDKPRRILFFTESPPLFSMLIADIMEIIIEL